MNVSTARSRQPRPGAGASARPVAPSSIGRAVLWPLLTAGLCGCSSRLPERYEALQEQLPGCFRTDSIVHQDIAGMWNMGSEMSAISWLLDGGARHADLYTDAQVDRQVDPYVATSDRQTAFSRFDPGERGATLEISATAWRVRYQPCQFAFERSEAFLIDKIKSIRVIRKPKQ